MNVCVQGVSFLVFLGGWVGAAPHGLRDLSSPPRDETRTTAVKVLSPNHWTTRELPVYKFLCGHMFSFPLGIYLGVELWGHLVTQF